MSPITSSPKPNRKAITFSVLLLCAMFLMPPKPAYALQKAEKKVLGNGLTLLVLEQHTLPFVTVRVSVRAGAVYDPAGKEGLANITANLLTRGTKNYTAQELAETIEFVGGGISSSGGRDFSEISLTVLTKDLDLGFKLLSEVLSQPTFAGEELERERKEIVGNIIQQKEDPATVAYKKFSEVLYAGHPYWHPVEGVEESVPKLTRDDVLNFYKNHYAPNNSTMVVVGDINQSWLDSLLNKYFSKWPKKEINMPAIAAPKILGEKKQELLDQELTQATVILGHLGISRLNPDYYTLYVMNYILGGGGFSSRLLANIRDEQGLAYSAASYFYPAYFGGSFKVTVQTKNENTARVIESTLAEIKKMRSGLVTEDELAAAKSYLTGSFPLKLDTNSKVASYLAYMENYGLGLDYFEKFPKIINSVTRKQILKAAKKYLNPDNYLLVVVADQKKAGLKEK